MIRPLTCLCLLSALGSGLYLYSEKHRTELLDREIGRVIHATEADRQRTGLLVAEWSLLNEPSRLETMAGRYLKLDKMAPTQFVQLADLAGRLPAPVVTPPGGSTDDEEAPIQEAAPQPQDPAAPVVAAMTPKPETVAPHGQTKAPARLLAHLDAKAKPPHHVALADREDALMQRGTPLPLASPQPIGASVFSAMARPMPVGAPRPVVVAAVPSYAAATPYSGGYVGSALGGRSSLPPPTPYGAGAR